MAALVRDGLIPESIIDAALASVLPPESRHWENLGAKTAGPGKVGRGNDERGGTFLRLKDDHPAVVYVDEAIASTVSQYYDAPRPDHSYCGLFQMFPGQELSPHRDRNTCRNSRFRRRVGILVFLNDPDGGLFQVYTRDGIIVQEVQPVRGRLVMFDINEYHGVSPVGPDSRRLALATHLASRVTSSDGPPHPEMTWLVDDWPKIFGEEGTS